MHASDNLQAVIDQHFLALALAQAHQAEAIDEVPVGAVLVNADNMLIASAHNQPISQHDPTAHAEIVCLRTAGERVKNYRLLDCTMYVTLEPCPMCTAAMVHARIARVVYACPDLRTGACGTALNLAYHPQLNHHIKTDFVELASAKTLLQNFFRVRR